MKLACRLTKGMDLKKSIEQIALDNNFSASVVISSVGCLDKAVIRMAGGKEIKMYNQDFEIVSLNGTISENGSHLHILISDKDGNCIGGHLCNGCSVNTTCELVIESLEGYKFVREFDESTGYKELVITKEESE